MKKQEPINHRQLLRLRKILAFMRERERITQAELAKANECSTKSIQRDIEVLKANGWPIEFDKRGHFFCPLYSEDLKTSKNSQVAALVLAGCSINRHLMEHFPTVAMAIRGSVLDLPDVQSLAFQIADTTIFAEKCSMDFDQLEVFGAVARNIVDSIAIEFQYRTVSKASAVKRSVYPISLKQKETVWYLIGYDLERNALRVFTLSKIKEARTSIEIFQKPAQNIIAQALSFGEFSIWDTGGESKKIYAVKVRLSHHAADFVRSHKIHHSQRVELIDDDSVILKLETSDLIGVNLWLRKFMHLVQVIEPKILKDQFIEDLQEALKINKQV